MKSPHAHLSPEPLNFPAKFPANSMSSSRSTGSLKSVWTENIGQLKYKNKNSTLTRENIDEFTKRYSSSSPYYKGLTNFYPVHGTSHEAESTTTHDLQSLTSPYYKGLTDFSLVINREKPPPAPATSMGTSIEAESTITITNELQPLTSPYYKGLTDFSLAINRERPQPPPPPSPPAATSLGTSIEAESTSSKTSFSVKIQEWSSSCFSFKTKDDIIPTMIKVYSSEISNEKSLRERVSEPTSPPPSPPRALPRAPPRAAVIPKSTPPLEQEPPSSPARRVAFKTSEVKEEEKKYFWADRYRPRALEDFICNKDKAIELQTMAKKEDCHHFMFEGQPGVGKRTMIWALLREAFGPDKVQARDECKTFDLKGEQVSSIMVNVKESSQHVEVNLSEVKGYENQVIVELIKETNNRLQKQMMQCNHDNCRAIILYEADKLSTDALLYIKWILEKYRGCHKIFFCCNDASKLQPIKALCNLVQLMPPSNEEIVEVLEFIARKEEIELPKQLAERIAINSKKNLRQAIRSFEATCRSSLHLKEDQVIMSGWEDDIADIAKSIVEKQSPKQLYDIRRKLQNLIKHSVSPEFIFQTLRVELKKNVDESLYGQIDKMYKEYNGSDKDKLQGFPSKRHEEMNRNHNSAKENIIQQFMRIEEFTAKFMSYYKGELAMKAPLLQISDPSTMIK